MAKEIAGLIKLQIKGAPGRTGTGLQGCEHNGVL